MHMLLNISTRQRNLVSKKNITLEIFFFKSSTKCEMYLRINSLKCYKDIFILRTGRGLPKYIEAKVILFYIKLF